MEFSCQECKSSAIAVGGVGGETCGSTIFTAACERIHILNVFPIEGGAAREVHDA